MDCSTFNVLLTRDKENCLHEIRAPWVHEDVSFSFLATFSLPTSATFKNKGESTDNPVLRFRSLRPCVILLEMLLRFGSKIYFCEPIKSPQE
jgi:hypothetical protein